MGRSLLIWGVLLTVGGLLPFQFGVLSLYPEVIGHARAGNLRQFWKGLTVAQKLSVTALEVPSFGGVVLVVVALVVVALVTRKQSRG
jgi:hypothetical protein